jgi:hypothetical protein
MKKFGMKVIAGVLALAGMTATVAQAQPEAYEPASVLVYPYFDSRPQNATMINVTNTNTDRSVCADNDNLMTGDVRLHFVYYGDTFADINSGEANWLEFDRFEDLTPGDTLTVLAWTHNPEMEMGFLTVRALSPDTDEPIDFDYIIGSAYMANAALDLMWSYVPYAFQAVGSTGTSTCGHDIVTTDPGTRFDDSDYVSFPDVLFLDMFIEERIGLFENKLVLMSTSGQDFINETDFLIWNNREERFSRTHKFVCWTSLPLSGVSQVVKNLGGDPDEFLVQTGWIRIDGRRVLDLSGNPVTDGDFANGPALLGVYMQTVRSEFQSGHELHFEGSQNASLPN